MQEREQEQQQEKSVGIAGWMTLVAVLLLVTPYSTTEAQTLSPEKQTVLTEAESLDAQIGSIAHSLWAYAETGLVERRSAELLASALEAEGFEVERGVANMPTAFLAECGSGRPVVGVLAEYDALPGLGNAPVSSTKAMHGHTLGGAGGVEAAAAILPLVRGVLPPAVNLDDPEPAVHGAVLGLLESVAPYHSAALEAEVRAVRDKHSTPDRCDRLLELLAA